MERPCESCDFVSGLHFSLPEILVSQQPKFKPRFGILISL